MDCVGLDELTRRGEEWPERVVMAVALGDVAHAAEANPYAVVVRQPKLSTGRPVRPVVVGELDVALSVSHFCFRHRMVLRWTATAIGYYLHC